MVAALGARLTTRPRLSPAFLLPAPRSPPPRPVGQVPSRGARVSPRRWGRRVGHQQRGLGPPGAEPRLRCAPRPGAAAATSPPGTGEAGSPPARSWLLARRRAAAETGRAAGGGPGRREPPPAPSCPAAPAPSRPGTSLTALPSFRRSWCCPGWAAPVPPRARLAGLRPHGRLDGAGASGAARGPERLGALTPKRPPGPSLPGPWCSAARGSPDTLMDLRSCSLLLLWTLVVALALLAREVLAQRVYTNTWAVLVPAGPRQADRLAKKHGFLNLGPIFGDYYHFRHSGVVKRSLSPHQPWHSRLAREPQVHWLEQQVAKRRTKRDIFMEPTDPKFPQQWYLYNTNQRDLNVRQAWEQGYTGKGIVVSILDDGIEKNHPDLEGNYDPGASFDVNDQDPDPQPRYTQMNDNRHGTRCAGEVAAVANNGICGVGVAYNARIGGVRMLDGEVTDAVEAHSLGLNPNHIHIYSASWGPEDDGKTVDGPARLAEEAFFRGVSQGRGGLGSIFVWASGNGGREHDSCNCDGYTNSIYTLSISSTTQYGNVPWYSEACSSTLATTYSSGNQNEKQIVTTDLRQKCTESHTGTSASAPLAAGIIALALEANKNLTWRDMQHLVVQTSKPAHLNANDWVTNGVGRKVSHSYGYGLLDAGAMVSLAKNWTTVGPQRKCVIDILAEPKDIGKRLEVRRKVDACLGKANYISRLEHAQARLTLSYNRRGDLAIHLVSPMGTRSTLLASRPHDYSADGFNDWAFMTTHSWDEDPAGDWVLEIENTSDANNYGTLTKFTLVLYGTATESPSLSNQLESSGCKTLTSSQTCVVCEEGYYLHQKSCLKHCPPGFAPGVQSTHYALENSVEPISPHLCLPCHPSCATCSGPTANECLTCPAHSHFSSLDLSCSHQTQSSRASPALAEGEGLAEAPPPANLPVLIASLSCVLIVVIFVTVFLALQLRSGFSLRGVKVYALDSGIISYKGLPSDVWQEEGPSESDGEEYEAHSERTAFIRDQSAL